MRELILYALIFLALLAHCLLAGKLYRIIHQDDSLSLREKNQWKLKALIFPAVFWHYYHQGKRRRKSMN
jgi:hypothetical protein